MAYTQADLDMADLHVREGAARIADLEQRIARDELQGISTTLQEHVLSTMLATIDLMVDNQREIAAYLRAQIAK
jgi:hypothetical protein